METTAKRQKFNICLLKDTKKGGVNAEFEEQIPCTTRTEQQRRYARQMGQDHHNNIKESNRTKEAPAERVDISRNTI